MLQHRRCTLQCLVVARLWACCGRYEARVCVWRQGHQSNHSESVHVLVHHRMLSPSWPASCDAR